MVKLSACHWATCAELPGLHHEHLLELVLQLMATLAQVWRNHQALVIEGAVIQGLALPLHALPVLLVVVAEGKPRSIILVGRRFLAISFLVCRFLAILAPVKARRHALRCVWIKSRSTVLIIMLII